MRILGGHARSRSARAMALAAAAVLLVAACGDGDDQSSSPDGDDTEATEPSETTDPVETDTTDAVTTTDPAAPESTVGDTESTEPTTTEPEGVMCAESEDPIKVMALMTTESQIFGFPQQAAAVAARAASINDDGGVCGRMIEIEVCNDNADPNVAGACARQAVDEGFVAVAGGISLHGDVITDTLEQGGVAYVGAGPISAGDFQSSVSFPLDGGTLVAYSLLGIHLVTDVGCQAIDTFAADTPGSQDSADFLELGIESAGATLNQRHTVPNVNPDYAPTVAAAVSDGADCVVLNIAPQEAVKAIPALAQGAPDVTIAAADSTVPPALVGALGEAAEGIVLTGAGYALNSTEPGVEQFLAEMETHAGDIAPDSLAMRSWAGMNAIGQVLAAIDGEITAESFLATITTVGDIDTGVNAPISFAEENPVEGFNRVFNTSALTFVVEGGSFTQTSPDFISVAEAIAG